MKKSKTKTHLVSNFYNAYLLTETQCEMKSKLKEPRIKIAYESYDKYLKRKFEISFFEVRDIINILDPYGLIAMGLPDDEYEGEVGNILLDIFSTNNEKELLHIVIQQFGNNFENQIKVENKCKDLAKALYKWKISKTRYWD